MRVIYYDSGWPLSIGNAFLDYGSAYAIKRAAPNAELHYASEVPRWICWANGISMDRSLDMADIMDVDYVVVSGMNMCDEFAEVHGPVVKRMAERGVKVVFSGCGGYLYTTQEVENFKHFLGSFKPYGFVARADVDFENFKGFFEKSYCGVDCAFFISDAFKPAPLLIKDYVVYTFDTIREPAIEAHGKKIIRTHNACMEVLPQSFDRRESRIVFQKKWPFVKDHKDFVRRYYRHPDTLISDKPEDYLNLFAHAHATYADRVHSCVPTLAFGHWARLYSDTPRAYLFDRVGAGELRKKLVKLDLEKITAMKDEHIGHLRKIFGTG